MRVRNTLVPAVFLTVAALVTTACGQKPGVDELGIGPGGQYYGDNSAGVGADGLPLDPAAAGPGGIAGQPAANAPGAGGSTGGGSTGGSTGGGAGGTRPGGGGGGTPGGGGPGDRTGLTDTTIKIGVHAPVTGAAAFPQQSFQSGVGVWANHINSKGGIHGRKIEIVFRDDRFDPNSARGVCKELAQQQKVFLLIGAGGSDQIDACARYATSVNTPYLSAGVHETRPNLGSLNALRTFYAMSLTYEEQVPLLVNVAKTDLAGKKVAVIVADNDSLNNFYAKIDGAMKQAIGANVVLSRRIPKKTDVDAPAIATQICNSGAQAVMWNASPSGLINVSKSMTCSVQFFGPGNTNGLNIVATGGCPNVSNALFFSSFPGLDKIGQMDPEFDPAYRRKTGSAPDDIGLALWGAEKLVGSMLQAAGKDLSREKFLATLASGKRFDTGVYPGVQWSGNDHFGGTAMHLLRADCGARQYRTQRLNVTP